jgi:hypothetical protein
MAHKVTNATQCAHTGPKRLTSARGSLSDNDCSAEALLGLKREIRQLEIRWLVDLRAIRLHANRPFFFRDNPRQPLGLRPTCFK